MNGHHIDGIEVDGRFPFELFVRVASVVQKVIVKCAKVVFSAIARGLELPLAIALNLGIYNLCRKHLSLGGMTPAQAAGVEVNRWTIEDVLALTARYWQPKREAAQAAKAAARRAAEDAEFERALAEQYGT